MLNGTFNLNGFAFEVLHFRWIFMPKSKKAPHEIASLITMEIGVSGLEVSVRKDHAYGWQPVVEYAPGNQLGFQRRADEIADKLRETYQLNE